MPLIQKNSEDPFSFHLYLGCGFKTSWFMHKAAKRLNEDGVKVSLKYDLSFPDKSVYDNINYGIDESYRCVILVTNDFEQDLFAGYEIERLKKKAKKFTRKAVIIINMTNSNTLGEHFDEIQISNNKSLNENFDLMIEELRRLLNERERIQLNLLYKEGFGVAAAFFYFYGYLKIILPGMQDKFYQETLRDVKLIKNAVPKYLIVIPEDCKGRIYFTVEGRIETTDKYVLTVGSRAGVRYRDYKCSVHKITDHQGEEFYFAGEFSTPTLTMYESYIHGKIGIEPELYQDRNVFFLTLESLLNKDEETRNSYKILYWRNMSNKLVTDAVNPKEKDENDDFYDFMLNAICEEIEEKRSFECECSLYTSSSYSPSPQIGNTIDLIEIGTANPKGIYDTNKYCVSKFDIPGLCLSFIYSSGFNSTRRNGYHKDEEHIETTFKRLQFQLEIHTDMSTEDLEKKLEGLKEMDWKKYGCVACCIASHGKIGEILTTTSYLSINKIMNYFSDSSCPGLKDKPILFFIQCCLTDEDPKDVTKGHDNNLIPRHENILACYSCLPGSLSYRSMSGGGPFFASINECFHPNSEIRESLAKINKLTNDKITKINPKYEQHPFQINSSINSSIYL